MNDRDLSALSMGFLFSVAMFLFMGHWLLAVLELVLLYSLLRLFEK